LFDQLFNHQKAMPRTAAANQLLKDARRETILAAARTVFATRGLGATRVSHIATKARISQGLVYHYFPTKEALFTEIVEGALREFVRLADDARRAPGSAWERLQRLCELMLAGVLDAPDYPLVILQAFTSDAVPEEARTAVARYGSQSMRHMVGLIRAGQAEGTVVAGDPVELALAFSACIQGIAMSRLQVRGPEVPLPRAETVLRLLRA
jgi:AcrR family transcriptional regulator